MFFCISMLLLGCNASTPPEEPISGLEVQNLSPNATDTSIPSHNTPALNQTETPIPVITKISSPIPTPIGNGEREQVLWLFETNNGCLLPCFWGITPGETEWAIAEELFQAFDNNIYQSPPDSITKAISYEVDVDLPRGIFVRDETRISGFFIQDDVVKRIDVNMPFFIGDISEPYLADYKLPNFLTRYGQPSQIWLATSPAPREGELPFRLLLYYSELGIVAMYTDNAIVKGDMVVGCPQNNLPSTITVWSLEANLSLEDIKAGNGRYTDSFRSLEEATNMDVLFFYEVFKEPANLNCLATPVEVW